MYIRRKRFNKELEALRRNNLFQLDKPKKMRRRRAICIGRPISKMIPMKYGIVKASVELDKLELLSKNMFQELKNTNPTFDLLFEKNLPNFRYPSYVRKIKMALTSNSRGNRTQRSYMVYTFSY